MLIIDDDQLPEERDLELAFDVWQVCSIYNIKTRYRNRFVKITDVFSYKDANYNLIGYIGCYDCMIKEYQLSCLISHIRCTKEGLEVYNGLVKIFSLLLCIYI